MIIEVKCSECDFKDKFEPDEFGLNYYQAVGTCPFCNAPIVTEDGRATKKEVAFRAAERR
jgi:hypothetical protein